MACDSTNGNILPINLDLDNMVNVSPQLSHFVYDFTPCATYKVKYECPRWLKLFNNKTACEGSIEIIQDQVMDDLLNFATIGNLTGTGGGGDDHKNKITCYYFPQSLNLYDGGEPNGGELVIELEKKIRGEDSRVKKELFLIFMPVYKANPGEMATSIEWFKSVIPKRPLNREYITHTTANVSLNNVLPKAPFWVYNDIHIHGTCGENKGGFDYGEVTAIFFMEQTVLIDRATYSVAERLGQSPPGNKFCKGKEGDNNTISWDCNFLPGEDDGTNGKKCKTSGCNTADPANGNNAQKWMAAWYPTEPSEVVTDNAETGTDTDPNQNPGEATPAATPGAAAGAAAGAPAAPAATEAGIPVRTLEKVRRCCIFKNEVGTTLGPGLHNKTGDPFSLTCEPIVDAEDGSPIEGKDRLEWVKDVYKGVPPGLKSMFWIVLFVILLTGILAGIYTFIFKNIGLFITQNEIVGRENLK